MPTSNRPSGNYIQNCLENSTKNSICVFGQSLVTKTLRKQCFCHSRTHTTAPISIETLGNYGLAMG